jgi:hypothetical protein
MLKIQDAKKEVMALGRLQKKVNELIQNNAGLRSGLAFINAKKEGKKIDKKLRQKRNILLKQYEVMTKVKEYLEYRNIPMHKITSAIEEVYGGKVNNPSGLAEQIVNLYKMLKSLSEKGLIQTSDFLKDQQSFLNAIDEMVTNIGKVVETKVNQLLNDNSIKSVIDDLLITNPFGIEDEKELLSKMLTNTPVFEFTYNSYIKELFNSSDNKMTQNIGKLLESLEDIQNGKPKLDTTLFFRLFNAIANGKRNYNHDIGESIALFFYLNGNTADGKKLPINYLHHNSIIRQLTHLLLTGERKAPETPEEQFAVMVNTLLDSAIRKLPEKQNILLFRGENATPITFKANKGDYIVYPTPVSTSSIEQATSEITYHTINENGEIEKNSYKTAQGAKVFVRGNGTYARINNSIINGERPEQFEGQREFLKEVKDYLGVTPQGSVINIHADRAYSVPNEYLTVVNKGQGEYLLPPNSVFRVVGKLKGEHYGSKSVAHKDGESGGIYTLIVETVDVDKMKPKKNLE